MIIAGVIQYIFDDEVVAALLERIDAPIIWLRSTCTLKPQRENVENDGYASCYRNVPETHALLSRRFTVTSVDRIYPDEHRIRFRHEAVLFRDAPGRLSHAATRPLPGSRRRCALLTRRSGRCVHRPGHRWRAVLCGDRVIVPSTSRFADSTTGCWTSLPHPSQASALRHRHPL